MRFPQALPGAPAPRWLQCDLKALGVRPPARAGAACRPFLGQRLTEPAGCVVSGSRVARAFLLIVGFAGHCARMFRKLASVD